ncbi:MAG: shikimate dehydrogenase [Rhizobiales bacterium]|nr:shikimate dehydrogenase [Hyphomicrobiales bacterium]
MTLKACVIGWPISHSRSPIVHNYWINKYGIDGIYERVPVEPGNLPKFIRNLHLNGYRGCNVTIPHKEAVFDLVAPADDSTRLLGAVNTVYVRDGATLGSNTDGEGFLANLSTKSPSCRIDGSKVFVLGAGGAAMAIVNALLESDAAEIIVCNRTPERSEKLRQKFGNRLSICAWEQRSDGIIDSDLLVNATALGMKGQPPLELDLTRLPSKAVVMDTVYVPLATPLLIAAGDRGNPTVDGLGMLLYQAVRGFELWFGVRPQVNDELYNLVARSIDPEYWR